MQQSQQQGEQGMPRSFLLKNYYPRNDMEDIQTAAGILLHRQYILTCNGFQQQSHEVILRALQTTSL